MLSIQELAYKEKRSGDARDSWYMREGFESLLEEGMDKEEQNGEATAGEAAAQPKDGSKGHGKDDAKDQARDHGEDGLKVRKGALVIGSV